MPWTDWRSLQRLPEAPTSPGVYCIAVKNGAHFQPQYIGAAWGKTGLKGRLSTHHRRLLRFFPLDKKEVFPEYYATHLETVDDPRDLETYLITRFYPEGNRRERRPTALQASAFPPPGFFDTAMELWHLLGEPPECPPFP